MSAYSHGRHEHGQNFLTDSRVIASLMDRVAGTTGPLIEIITRGRILPSRQAAQAWAERAGVRPTALPSDLTVAQMVSLFESSGVAPPRRRR